MNPKILVFAGSNRTGSFTQRLAAAAMRELALTEAEVSRISLVDYPLPILDGDGEREAAIPESAMKLGRMIAAHDGVLIASPEYNASIPPLLKNAIDWVGFVERDGVHSLRPWRGRVVALCSASGDRFGGIRGLYHLRAVMMELGAQIVTEQCAVSFARDAFGDKDELEDEELRGRLADTCRSLLEHVRFFRR